MTNTLHIIGAGMAGSEAAWQAASQGIQVILHEMRPKIKTFAHKTDNFAEMVCSNSFRSNDSNTNAVGLLHWEMREANGLIIKTAEKHKLPAGGALAVDRLKLSNEITHKLKEHPNIKISNEEVNDLPSPDFGQVIIATGPLTSTNLANSILKETGKESLAFFDAIAPIIHSDTIDLSKTWYQSRYDKGDTLKERKAYLNCPMNKQEYENFIKTYPKSQRVQEATFKAAMSYYFQSPKFSLDQDDTNTAVEKLQIFLNLYPDSEYAERANQMIAELQEKIEKKNFEIAKQYYTKRDYKASIKANDNFISSFPGTKYREEALFTKFISSYQIAVNSIDTKKKDRLEELVQQYNTMIRYYPESLFLEDLDKKMEKVNFDIGLINQTKAQ